MSKNYITIIDTGLGNIGSVARMIHRIGGNPHICSNPKDIVPQRKIILPGVGHYDHGISSLIQHGFDQTFWKAIAEQGNYIMGICLGMQLLCNSSEEGSSNGLGLVDADVKKFRFSPDQNLKAPHMGWNVVKTIAANSIIPKSEQEERFYFVHNFYVVPNQEDITIGVTNYGGDFCCAFKHRNIIGVQFHPEKSHQFGMSLFKRFLEL